MTDSKKFSLVVNIITMLTGFITLVVSVAYVAASAVALLYYGSCTVPSGDGIFSNLYVIYFQDPSCHENQGPSFADTLDLTRPYSVYVMIIVTLTASLLCIVAATILLYATTAKEGAQYMTVIVVFYVAAHVISLVIDITFATHFGQDYSNLTELMSVETSSENLQWLRFLRIGVMLLITIILKGFVIPLINIIYLVLLIVYLVQHQQAQKTAGHPIHKLGSLYAYRDDMSSNSQRPNTINSAPVSPSPVPTLNIGLQQHVDPKMSPKPRDYKYNRSISDQHVDPQPAFGFGSRPFSYLEDPSPTANPPKFNRSTSNIPEIHVPAPDYSPIEGRRLKSALKNTYM